MPIRYDVDHGLRLVCSRASGTIGPDDLVDHVRSVATDPSIGAGFNEILDLRGASECRIQVPDLHRAVEESQDHRHRLRRSALVCADQDILPKLLLYQEFSKQLPVEVGVFDRLLSAAAWLDVSEHEMEGSALSVPT